jgi:3-dehydroquinate synthase
LARKPDLPGFFVSLFKDLYMISPVSTIAASAYSIHIGGDALAMLASFLKKNRFSSVFILVDENSLEVCLPVLSTRVTALASAEVIELESGEKNKTIDMCMQVWSVLAELGADRNSLLINLGGGVITDMGGFIAATFKRGITFIHVPTTLLAQVDAAIGGKTGVDLDGLKNQVGVFSDPKELFIYPAFLKTLSPREFRSGFAEILKHALVADAEFWHRLKDIQPDPSGEWEEIILCSVRIKTSIVEEDPYESGKRKILNFGHTVGHAMETYFLERSESSLLHGEAVAAGMVCEAFLSNAHAGLSKDELEEITATILKLYGGFTLDPMDDQRILELMRHDKKNESGQLNLVLLDQIGHAVFNRKINPNSILECLNYYRFAVQRHNSPKS